MREVDPDLTQFTQLGSIRYDPESRVASFHDDDDDDTTATHGYLDPPSSPLLSGLLSSIHPSGKSRVVCVAKIDHAVRR